MTFGKIFLTVALSANLFGLPLTAEDRSTFSEGLLGHWKLLGDCRDYSEKGNHGTGKNVDFTEGPDGSARGAASFNGRDGYIEIPDAESLHLGKTDFSLAAWVKPETVMRGIFGDIVSKFDAAKRRGFNFHLAGSSSGYSSMCDARHVHFGIDDGYLGPWEDCGKPWASNTLISNLAVFEGQLYAGIADAEKPQDACRVFRYSGGKKWIDCGRLGDDPNHLTVQSLFVHRGKLYAGTGIWYWQQAWGNRAREGKPRAAKPRVFVYEGGTKWRDLGQVGEGTRLMCMGSFNGELYAGIDRFPDERKKSVPGRCFKYDGEKWIDCGSPDTQNIENFLPFGGTLYCTTHGSVFRYEGGQKWTCIGNCPYEINQIHSFDVYRGRMHIGTWPQGYVLRYEGGEKWANTGRLGIPPGDPEINEVNDLTIYNGKMFAGVIPKAELYRYEADGRWTLLQSLGHQPTLSRDDEASWCRLTAMASYQGKLFAGTGSCRGATEYQDPDGTLGRVYAIRAGQVVSHERDIGGGWTHLAVVRRGAELQLYVNGSLSASCSAPEGRIFDLTNAEPLSIGFGAQTYFTGAIADVRLYDRAINSEEIKQLQQKD
ncbi:MAG: hypothetical protein IT426_18715 [Pirellulales bacterium]|nr:hypothetical protein [Pirellulales bacterium]